MNVTRQKLEAKPEQGVHQEKLSNLFNAWRETEGKISLYGPAMPQAKQVVEAFYRSLEKVFESLPSFSIVKRAQVVEIIARDATTQADHCHRINASSHTAPATQALDKFKVNCLTFNRGLQLDELQAFFCGLHMSTSDAKQYQGLGDYLKRHHITHIKADQQHLRR